MTILTDAQQRDQYARTWWIATVRAAAQAKAHRNRMTWLFMAYRREVQS